MALLSRLRSAALVPLACASLSGCDGLLDSPLGPLAAGSTLDGNKQGPRSREGSGDFATGNYDPAVCQGRELHPGQMPGLVRLTHRQYEFAVRDLLGLEAGAQEGFVADQEFHGFTTNAANLSAPENQVLRYRAAAERLAEQAASNLTALAPLIPCLATSEDASCRAAFVADFLKLLFRRPLEPAEQARYTGLFEASAELYDTGSAFQRGVRGVLEAALQSPSFLYRAELRDLPLDGQVVALSDHELAARLALTLWSSLPDAALMAKADAGELHTDEQVEAEARRMLDDPKAARVFDDFHAQWLEFHKLRFEKDPAQFPDYDQAAFAASARAEALAFARHVGLSSNGSIADLYSEPVSFVDATLAGVYGVESAGPELSRVELDPSTRAGLFTQAGFLAGHADPLNGSPIHRGAFVQKRVLCRVYGSLPANVGNLPERSAEIVTTRDQVEVKTEPPQCQVCHSTINPAGFAFEAFDGLGRSRSHDNGEPVDARGTLRIDDQELSFDGPVELAHVLAGSDTAMRCYQTQWFRYAVGRGESDDDVCLLHEIDRRAAESGHTIKEVLVALTLSRGFRFRAQEEL